MRFKRVSKLLACVLSVSMCTVPVFASNLPTKDITSQDEQKVDTSFGVESVTLKVKVPTKLDLRVNPLYSTATGDAKKVKAYTFASKEFVISNNTSANNAGVALLCQARATATAGEGVQVSYNKFTPQNGDTAKLVHLELTSANAGPSSATIAESENKYDNTIDRNTVPVTSFGSRLQLPIEKPSGAGFTTAGYGAFAFTGAANTEADWTEKDVTVALTYRVRALPNATPVNNVAVTAVTATSANNLAAGAGTAIATLTKASLGKDVTVDGVAIHSPKALFDDYVLLADALDIAEDATSYTVKIKKEDPGLTLLAQNLLGKTQDLMIALSDGRVLVTTITMN